MCKHFSEHVTHLFHFIVTIALRGWSVVNPFFQRRVLCPREAQWLAHVHAAGRGMGRPWAGGPRAHSQSLSILPPRAGEFLSVKPRSSSYDYSTRAFRELTEGPGPCQSGLLSSAMCARIPIRRFQPIAVIFLFCFISRFCFCCDLFIDKYVFPLGSEIFPDRNQDFCQCFSSIKKNIYRVYNNFWHGGKNDKNRKSPALKELTV